MEESEFETLEMKAKGKKVEEKGKLMESQAKEEESKVEELFTTEISRLSIGTMDRVTMQKFEAMHKEVSTKLALC